MSKPTVDTAESTVLMLDPRELSHHPTNAEIYGDDTDADFIQSCKGGVLTPLIVTCDNVIISGHRRYRAAIAAGLDGVPVVVSELRDDLDIERALIIANVQRSKTTEQLARECKRLTEIESKQARNRQRTSTGGPSPQLVENLPQAGNHDGKSTRKTRDKVGEIFGISGRTVAKSAQVIEAIDAAETAGDDDRAAKIRAKLNNKSVDAAHRQMTSDQPISQKPGSKTWKRRKKPKPEPGTFESVIAAGDAAVRQADLLALNLYGGPTDVSDAVVHAFQDALKKIDVWRRSVR